MMRDDLGTPVALPDHSPSRVISLVPSLTEAVAATAPEVLVAATDWCTHPADLDVVRIRGTKNPDVPRIIDLQPDLVIANEEENRAADLEALRKAGISVWVTAIRTLDQAFTSLHRLAALLTPTTPPWLTEAEHAWSTAPTPPRARMRAIVPIWRRPWMVVGSDTFTGDVLGRLGIGNHYADHPERYPKIPIEDLLATAPDLVVLPDEPYEFSETDGPEAFPELRTALVSGRLLTWYGPSLVEAAAVLPRQLGL